MMIIRSLMDPSPLSVDRTAVEYLLGLPLPIDRTERKNARGGGEEQRAGATPHELAGFKLAPD